MLVTEPKIMLMDEPLAHLDTSKRKLRLELRRILRKHDIPAIYVTHFEDDVYALADAVSMLQNGVIVNASRLSYYYIQIIRHSYRTSLVKATTWKELLYSQRTALLLSRLIHIYWRHWEIIVLA